MATEMRNPKTLNTVTRNGKSYIYGQAKVMKKFGPPVMVDFSWPARHAIRRNFHESVAAYVENLEREIDRLRPARSGMD